jgi:hypothetical protein
MKKLAAVITALTLAAVMGCQDPVSDTGSDTEGVRFQAAIDGAQTRAAATVLEGAERAVGNVWTEGDAIGVSMLERGGTGIADSASNRKFVTSGSGAFAPASGAEAISVNRQVDFIAYYPYTGGLKGFQYPVDVSSQTNQEAIDLMTAAKAPADQSTGTVGLTFQHRLSGVILQISAGTNVSTNELRSVTAELTGQKVRGSYDINANQLSIPDTEGADHSLSFKMSADGKTGEVVILPALEGTGRTLKLSLLNTVTAKRETFTKSIANDKAFEPGSKYQFPITLNHKASGDYIVTGGFPGSIEDWNVVTEEASNLNPDGEIPDNGGGNTGNTGNAGGAQNGPITINGDTAGQSKFVIERYKTVPASGGPQFVSTSAYQEKSTGYKYLSAYLGRIDDQPVVWGDQLKFSTEGFEYTYTEEDVESVTETQSSTQTTTNTLSDSATKEKGVEASVGYSIGTKVEAGIEVGVPFGKVTGSVAVEQKLEASVTGHTTNTLNHTEIRETGISQTFEKSRTTMKTKSKTWKYTFSTAKGDIPNYIYRYTTFASSQVYAHLVFDEKGELLGVRYTPIIIPSTYSYGMDYAPDVHSFVKTGTSPDLTLTAGDVDRLYKAAEAAQWEPVDDKPSSTVPSIGTISVQGGALKYTYRVKQAGTINVTLVGGGAGGAGAAALYANTKTWMDWKAIQAWADYSGAGGPTILSVNGVVKLRAEGGYMATPSGDRGADGPNLENWAMVDGVPVPIFHASGYFKEDGPDGPNGERRSGTVSVQIGDTITIDVGWGGGGSGGSVNYNQPDAGTGDHSVNLDDPTCGAEGEIINNGGDEKAVKATRGGMGAMHSIKSQNPAQYPSDLAMGTDSDAAGSASKGAGGKTMGAGGKGGKAFADADKVYASGGGGGAAGGFPLTRTTVAFVAQASPQPYVGGVPGGI